MRKKREKRKRILDLLLAARTQPLLVRERPSEEPSEATEGPLASTISSLSSQAKRSAEPEP